MLFEIISKVYENTNNMEVRKLISNILGSKIDGNFVLKIGCEEIKRRKIASQQFFVEEQFPSILEMMQDFYFKSAIGVMKNPKLRSKIGNCSIEKAECFFMMSDFPNAYLSAKQTQNPELRFITSVACGRYDEAATIFSSARQYDSRQSKNKYISRYEFTNLYLLTQLACQSITKIIEVYDSLIDSGENLIYPEISIAINGLKEFSFIEVSTMKESLQPILDESIFVFPSRELLYKTIDLNMVTNCVRAFDLIRLESIKAITNIDLRKIQFLLIEGINKGLIKGKIDLVNNTFRGDLHDRATMEIKNVFERLMILNDGLRWK